MSNASFGVAITADDKTAKGVASAEKRLSKLGTGVLKSNERAAALSTAAKKKADTGILKSVEKIERATGRAFGAGSTGLIGRMSALGEVASSVGEGFGTAAASGGILTAAIGVLGVAATATVGILAGVAVATDVLMKKWSGSIVGASRFADTMGIATKSLQEFQGAAERLGIDKDTAGGAMGSLSQSLNDAKFGRNQAGVSAMAKAGIVMKTKADGTVDVEGMLPAIADAMARESSSGRRTLASAIGIPMEAIPAFAQGAAKLSKDMADVGRFGAVASQSQIDKARKWQRSRTMIGQMIDRGALDAGEVGADTTQGTVDALKDWGRGLIRKGGSVDPLKDFGPAVAKATDGILAPTADKIDKGGTKIKDGADWFGWSVDKLTGIINSIDKNYLGGTGGDAPVGGTGGGGSRDFVGAIRHAEGSRDGQVSPKGARGAMQVMPHTMTDPGFGVRKARDGSFAEINRVGDDYARAMLRRYGGDQTLAGAAYNGGPGTVDRILRKYGDPRRGEESDSEFTSHLPSRETREYVKRVLAWTGGSAKPSMSDVQRAAAAEHLHVTVELVNAPAGTRARVKRKNGAVSYAAVGAGG